MIPTRNRGYPDEPKGMEPSDTVIRISTCPDCTGRGWFLINPFATRGSNGAGGIRNITQCQTCQAAYAYYQRTGELPDRIPWPAGTGGHTESKTKR